jgi:hypothetical protein
MTNQIPTVSPADDPQSTPPDQETKATKDAFAITPAIGPLPPIYVGSAPGVPAELSGLWRAAAKAAREAGGWAAHYWPHHRTRPRSSYEHDDH